MTIKQSTHVNDKIYSLVGKVNIHFILHPAVVLQYVMSPTVPTSILQPVAILLVAYSKITSSINAVLTGIHR